MESRRVPQSVQSRSKLPAGLCGDLHLDDFDALHGVSPLWEERYTQIGRGRVLIHVAMATTQRVQVGYVARSPGLRIRGWSTSGTSVLAIPVSIDGLMAIVHEELREDAYSGHLFVFVSRRCDWVKILAWDTGGFVLFCRRLEEGRFKLPHMTPEASAVNIDATQLAILLDGIDFGRVGWLKRWNPPAPIEEKG